MDALTQVGLSSSGVAVVLIVYHIVKAIIGKKFISDCCGRKTEIGLNIENMTPINKMSAPNTDGKESTGEAGNSVSDGGNDEQKPGRDECLKNISGVQDKDSSS